MSRWAVLVVSQQRVAPIDLPTAKPLIVGRARGAGLELKDPRVDERHLSIRIVDDRDVSDDELDRLLGMTMSALGATKPATGR